MVWQQVYDPMGNMVISTLLAAIPVVVMLVALGFLHIKAHMAAGLGLLAAVVVAVFAYGKRLFMPGTRSTSTHAAKQHDTASSQRQLLRWRQIRRRLSVHSAVHQYAPTSPWQLKTSLRRVGIDQHQQGAVLCINLLAGFADQRTQYAGLRIAPIVAVHFLTITAQPQQLMHALRIGFASQPSVGQWQPIAAQLDEPRGEGNQTVLGR